MLLIKLRISYKIESTGDVMKNEEQRIFRKKGRVKGSALEKHWDLITFLQKDKLNTAPTWNMKLWIKIPNN